MMALAVSGARAADATASLRIRALGQQVADSITRERVLAAVSDLGYRPSGIARALKRRETRTLGLVITLALFGQQILDILIYNLPIVRFVFAVTILMLIFVPPNIWSARCAPIEPLQSKSPVRGMALRIARIMDAPPDSPLGRMRGSSSTTARCTSPSAC